jgi:phosphoesterase family protein
MSISRSVSQGASADGAAFRRADVLARAAARPLAGDSWSGPAAADERRDRTGQLHDRSDLAAVAVRRARHARPTFRRLAEYRIQPHRTASAVRQLHRRHGAPAQRRARIKDAVDFFDDLDRGQLPAVSYLKPDSFDDGHPASSKLDLLESLMTRVVDGLKRHPDLFDETAFFVTFDEGGGYWDSGFFQPIDFFGDGPRIPMIAVSKYSRGGRVVHNYGDHASLLKFIERNWFLDPLTTRSRDNLPNPVARDVDSYVPLNMPAVSDLFEMFDFDSE